MMNPNGLDYSGGYGASYKLLCRAAVKMTGSGTFEFEYRPEFEDCETQRKNIKFDDNGKLVQKPPLVLTEMDGDRPGQVLNGNALDAKAMELYRIFKKALAIGEIPIMAVARKPDPNMSKRQEVENIVRWHMLAKAANMRLVITDKDTAKDALPGMTAIRCWERQGSQPAVDRAA
jgi:hypothetical protein